ncbi:peptidoglycan DD-metalloendopeptidase family protein [Neobacillus sp. PS3-40]|uniref:murein hydrolase activator EnvC family protein n=1 Tax=Neobacillus sp. PS3-40 TaxID=3070679 RepID=UPI0027DEFA98|nr:peptidoglycan DD-metalloendopeptidase family protein [Neobacillus sp. PS3-40]WML46041.1 peptidoglycan DD-metalloendopeptidase family protein [Neobacillus sp. PS3-40]
MKKSFITLTVAAAVGMGSLFGGFAVKSEAASVSSLKHEQNKIHSQRSGLNSTINEADKKITQIQGKQVDVKQEMKRIDLSIGDTNSKIREKEVKVSETKMQITKLQAEVKVIQERITKRNELLKDRVRNYQENGGMVNYIDVLMGSSSFSDFIDRANAVATIMEADQDILKQAEADKLELETKQALVQKELVSLQGMLNDLVKMKQKLNFQKAEKDQLLGTLQAQEKKVQEDKMSLQEEEKILADQEAAIQKAIKLEQAHQAELARQRAAEAAAHAAHGGGNGGSADQAPDVSSGNFTRPAAGYISSGFGGRWGEFHYGVDIASHGSNVPIVAAADGVVIRSYYSSSYGNCIFLASSIDGQIYTTVYAHMETRLVGSGATVSKGQQIGIMGSTGESTGQHLHFELHRGPWTQDKRFAINPVGIVPL